MAANFDSSYGGCVGTTGPDTILLETETYTLSDDLPNITSEIVIKGNGPESTIIEASDCNPITLPDSCEPVAYRIFIVTSSGSLTLENLTLQHGNITNYHGGALLSRLSIFINKSENSTRMNDILQNPRPRSIRMAKVKRRNTGL